MTSGIKLTEAVHPFAFVVSEDSDGAGYLSRDQVTIGNSQTIVVGQVLSRTAVVADVTATAAATSTNTGNGTIALSTPPVDATVVGGSYRITMSGASAFKVTDPDGIEIGEGAAGTAFSNGIKFTISAATGGSAVAFVAGDSFVVNVDDTLADDIYVAWTGSNKAVAIAAYPAVTGASTTQAITVINAHATVRTSDLTFNGSASIAQIDQAKRELSKALIKFR